MEIFSYKLTFTWKVCLHIFMDKISIREISKSDLETIFNIEKHSYSNPWTFNDLEKEIQNCFSKNYLIKRSKNIIGYVFTHIVIDQMQINNFCISEKYRRYGYAKYFLNNILAYIKSVDIKYVYLDVRESNIAAFKLYSSSGFKIDCIRKKYYSDGENAILMSIDLCSYTDTLSTCSIEQLP